MERNVPTIKQGIYGHVLETCQYYTMYNTILKHSTQNSGAAARISILTSEVHTANNSVAEWCKKDFLHFSCVLFAHVRKKQ